MWHRLRRGNAGEPGAVADLVVLTRVGCHLCEQMLRTVRAVADEAASLPPPRVVDIDDALATGRITAEQHDRWTTLVPVLLVDGREAAHHHVGREQLAAFLGPARNRVRPRRPRRFGGSGGPVLE